MGRGFRVRVSCSPTNTSAASPVAVPTAPSKWVFPAAVCATLAGVYGLQQWRKRVGKSEEAPRSEGNTAGRSVRTLTAEDAIELVQFRYVSLPAAIRHQHFETHMVMRNAENH